MISSISNRQRLAGRLGFAICLVSLLFMGTALAKMPLVAKWGRYEQSFKSSVDYENAFQQCTLKASFVSLHL